LPEEARL